MVKGSDDSVKLDFGLYSTALPDALKKQWPYDFGLVYSVSLSREGLQTVMQVRNEGKEAFEFQILLHTYLRVDVRSRPLDSPAAMKLTPRPGHYYRCCQWPSGCDLHRQSS